MRLEEIRQRFKNEFVLIAVTKTDEDNVEILEGDVLAHSLHRDEIMALLGSGVSARRHCRVVWKTLRLAGSCDLKVYALRRVGSGLLATRVAMIHSRRVVRPLVVVDTGSLYTIVAPSFLATKATYAKNLAPVSKVSGLRFCH